ncbi:phage tail protein [Xenorhabdus bovienii]|uniref:phage tail-collar fiber domain-containing protein n=1 Tax=Xenorhabdus bovienii TaxID=40576 RepID=UPI0023B31103|nr:phage tail protein [Xenorhabdus bovienii]MDE9435335.1 phage tail protein [Xenorhabdus bovienii]
MSTKYFALLTQLGADKLANAAALGTKIEITHMAVGDGGGSLPTPDTKQTKLINEKRRAAINTLSIDPKNTNQIISEQVIPESEGGWWIREIGLFDKDGILIAVGNCAESYKPQLQEGSGRTQTIRMILIVSSTESVTLKVDPSVVLATREYVDDSIQKHSNSRNHPDATLKEKGFVILSSAVDSNSETHAATPKAVKAAYDFANAANNNANGRVPSGRKVNGKALSEDIHLKASDVDAYNKTETDARVNDAKAQAKAANDNADGRVPAGRKVNGKALNADISLNSGDVGAYSKGETDTRVNEAKALANTANQNAANANNNANTRLEKNQNGADIPNKPKFVENLGLVETVNQAKNAYPITGGKLNGALVATSMVTSQGDGRQHLALSDSDGRTRAWIYKDKDGDGIHINNGYGGTTEWILNNNGELHCPGPVNSYWRNTIKHSGYGKIQFLHEDTNDYILLETTLDGKGIYFVQRNTVDDKNQWVLYFPQKDGTVATIDDITNYSNTPIGSPILWPHAIPPQGYFECNGQHFDKLQYPKLAAVYPSSTVPDLRGEFVRGWDNGRGIDSERTPLSYQSPTLIRTAILDYVGDDANGVHAEAIGIPFDSADFTTQAQPNTAKTPNNQPIPGGNTDSGIPGTVSTAALRVSEWASWWFSTRPRNIAFLYIVRAA